MDKKWEQSQRTCLLFQEGSQQSCAKAIKLGSDEKVPTNWSTVTEPGPLPPLVHWSSVFKFVKPKTWTKRKKIIERNRNLTWIKPGHCQVVVKQCNLVHCSWQQWLATYGIIHIWTSSHLSLYVENTRIKWVILVPEGPPRFICS